MARADRPASGSATGTESASRGVRLGLVGDVMLGRLVDERFRGSEGDPAPADVWGTMLSRMRALDGLLINLECCLSTRGERWQRTHRPFHFRADPSWAVPALEAAGVDVACLANNHVLDYEVPALRDTLDHLAAADIEVVGAGMDLDAALEPGVLEVPKPAAGVARGSAGAEGDAGNDGAGGDGDGAEAETTSEDRHGTDDGTLHRHEGPRHGPGTASRRVVVVAFTDNTPEYGATEDRPGTAHVRIDPEDERTRRRVGTALRRAQALGPDLLVASLHWGPNMVERPPEGFRRFARWLVERGVDCVHGHSAHVFQGVEWIDGRPICYDAGDFVDDYRVDPRLRNDRSFLFELGLEFGVEGEGEGEGETDVGVGTGSSGNDGSDGEEDRAGGEEGDGDGDGRSVRRRGRVRELRLRPTAIEDLAVHAADGPAARWSRDRMRRLSEPYGTTFDRDGPCLVTRPAP